MITVFIENKPYEVKPEQNMLQVSLSLGFNLPYFCWHPALGSVGACRQCAVKQYKNETDTQGKIVMACMTPATDGIHISINDSEAKEFRTRVTEWLMLNHPHDCPICDEGGECHLQDMVVMTGHAYRRYRGKKRTYRNQEMGPFINHEMNRCIQCYRCVRFYRDYAGGRDLEALSSRNQVYFGRHQSGILENEFSGNLVEVCPTGVFTDKSLKKHFTRKWDLQTAPSICVHCGLGCNTIAGERYGMLRRILNRYNGEVNRYFLCDRGRYGYEFVNGSQRIQQPLFRNTRQEKLQPINKPEILKKLSSILLNNDKVIGIGSPRASLESNFALKTLVGSDRFYLGISDQESELNSLILKILQTGPARIPSLYEVESADAVLVLGEDVTNTAPMLALALRQSIRRKSIELADKFHISAWDDAAVREVGQQEKSPLYLATVSKTKLEDISVQTVYGTPNDIARLGFAIAQKIDNNLPAIPGLSDDTQRLIDSIVQALKSAKKPLIISGTSCGSAAIIQSAANIAWALCKSGFSAGLSYIVPECNSLGLSLLDGKSLSDAVQAVQNGTAETVIILENKLYRRADAVMIDTLLDKAKQVIVLDHISHATVAKADMVLPASAFAESSGTLINNECRAQRFYRVYNPNGDISDSWHWLIEMYHYSHRAQEIIWKSIDDIVNAIAQEYPILHSIRDISPPAGFRITNQRIPRQPQRYSGRTAISANINVNEPNPAEDIDSPLSFSMEGYIGQPPSALISRFWMPGWNSVQSLNKFQSEIGGHLHGGDPGQRLIEPKPDTTIAYFISIPESFAPKIDELLILPSYHIFGSEELSSLSPSIAELIPEPYLTLNPADGNKLQMNNGDKVQITLTLSKISIQLPVRFDTTIPIGVAGFPVGLPKLTIQNMTFPTYGTLMKII